ncbi:MAG: cytochrome c [Nitrospirota bacterium]|nr:cytochrome c [Nitrospirota bacterium]
MSLRQSIAALSALLWLGAFSVPAVLAAESAPAAASSVAHAEAPRPDINAKMLIERKGCLSCHSLNGKGGKMGPPLQSVAAWSDPDRMRKYIRDPRSVNPRSIMRQIPLTDDELEAVVEFLQSYKGTAKAPTNWPGKPK